MKPTKDPQANALGGVISQKHTDKNVASPAVLTQAGQIATFFVTHTDWAKGAAQELLYHVQRSKDGIEWADALVGWGVTDPGREQRHEFAVDAVDYECFYRALVEVKGSVTIKIESVVE